MFFWLVITCVLSWNVASGNAALARLAAVDAERVDINKQMDDAANAKATGPAQNGSVVQVALNAADPTKPVFAYCSRHPAQGAAATATQPNPPSESYTQLRICQRDSQVRQDELDAQTLVGEWLSVWRWLPRKRTAEASNPDASAQDPGRAVLPGSGMDRQRATILASVLGGTILPVAYGILGAAAAVVRALSIKMRESLLSPRDLLLSVVQLALGAVIGGCVGLFLTSASNAGSETPGLFGPVSLSASALSFIAGFGVDSVFVALEGLMSRVFNAPEPSRKIA